MLFERLYFTEFSPYLLPLFFCVLAGLIWIFLRRNIEKKSYPNASKQGRLTKSTDDRENVTESCASLSCIRCSKSVYSVENLLKKWNKLEQELTLSPSTKKRILNGIVYGGCKFDTRGENQQEPTVFYFDRLMSSIWYGVGDYPSEVSKLEKNSTLRIFLDEFFYVYKDLSSGWVANIVPSGGWYLFYLINQGVRVERNCMKCPQTLEIVEGLKSAMFDCSFGNVMFSVLLPGTRIAPHCGPANVRIRCHIPLQAPYGYCISVAGKERTWKKGKVLIFDDSFFHEVYCHDDVFKPRVILMIDLWHPSLSLEERLAMKSLFPPEKK